jgi:hypothetical protein
MIRKKALITGVTGQDGAYLARLLLEKGYEVHGMKRRASSFNTKRIDDVYVDPHDENVGFFLHYGDMTDSSNIMRLVQKAMCMSALKPPNTLLMSTHSARYVSSKPFALWGWKKRRAFIRRQPLSFMAKLSPLPRARRHHFIRGVPMPWRNFMPIGCA